MDQYPACVCMLCDNLTGYDHARIHSRRRSPLKFQRDGALRCWVPAEVGGNPRLEIVSSGWHLEGVGVVSSHEDSESGSKRDVDCRVHLDDDGNRIKVVTDRYWECRMQL